MFYITGISIAFFLALLLLSKKNKTLADKILFAWLLVMGLHLSLFVLRNVELNIRYSYLLGVEIPFPLFHGPFLYLYTAAATGQLPANRKMAFLHLVTPFLSLLMFSNFFLLDAIQKIEVYKNKGAGYELPVTINLVAIYLSGIIYVLWSSYLLLKHRRNIEQQFSDTEKISLNWLRYLVYGIGLIWLAVLWSNDNLIFGTTVIFILLLGFFGLKQAGIFTHSKQSIPENTNKEFLSGNEGIVENSEDKMLGSAKTASLHTNQRDPIKKESPKKKYQKSGLTEEQSKIIHDALTKLMNEEKAFTEPELTLSDLAFKLNVHPNHLSQVINEWEEKNFFDYINTLRIEEFKHLASLPENKQYTILSLAYECGFNSKSSFNRYFKKVTGLSPSEHLKD